MCIRWTILVTLEWIQLDHGVWSFLCIVGFGLLNFFENFCIYIHQRYWPVIFFSSVFVWFWYQVDGGLIEWTWECSLPSILWNSLRRIGISSYLYVWQNSPVKLSGPGLLFAGRFFFITGSMFTFSDQSVQIMFLLDSILVGCVFLETYPFLLGCPIF